jgi:hypothetical protein
MRHYPDSLNGRLHAFFVANPGECLTIEDIMAKFDCTRRRAHVSIYQLQLESVTVYRVPGSEALPEISAAPPTRTNTHSEAA